MTHARLTDITVYGHSKSESDTGMQMWIMFRISSFQLVDCSVNVSAALMRFCIARGAAALLWPLLRHTGTKKELGLIARDVCDSSKLV